MLHTKTTASGKYFQSKPFTENVESAGEKKYFQKVQVSADFLIQKSSENSEKSIREAKIDHFSPPERRMAFGEGSRDKINHRHIFNAGHVNGV